MVQYSDAQISELFHALGDPTRLAILRQVTKGEISASALAKPRSITLTATLKHLRILEEAGLTQTIKVGRERRCRMVPDRLKDIEAWVEETRRTWNYRLDRLDAFLNQTGEDS